MTILKQAHERNILWMAQRDTCLGCKSCFTRTGTAGETILHCTAVTAVGMRFGPYCIDVRSDSGECRSTADLFQPKE